MGPAGVLVTVISEVASAYFELRELDLDLEIARRTLASRQRSLRLTQPRQERGVATRLDIRQAENLLYTARPRFRTLERQITQKENAIRLLLALPPGDILRGLSLRSNRIPPSSCWASQRRCWSGAPTSAPLKKCW